MARVAVLGAGPAGLMAARRVAQAGHEVTVVERADAVGGMAGSYDVAGIRVDHGSHRLHPATPPHLLAELRDLLGDDLRQRRRNGRLRLAGTWVSFPLRTGELVRSLPPDVARRLAVDAATGPLRRRGAPPASFGEAVRAGLGPTVAELLYEPYARKLWGVDADALDADLARRRVSAGSPAAIARRLVAGRREAPTFWYPRGGFGRIPEVLAEAAIADGARLLLGHDVTTVEPGVPVVVTAARVDGGAEERIVADAVLSTIPLPALGAVVRPGPPVAVRDGLTALSWRGMLLVHLVLERPTWTPFDAHYLPGDGTPVSRISEPTRYRDDPADPVDRTVVTLEVPADVDDGRWAMGDDDLAASLVGSLAGEGLPVLRPAEVVVRRLPRVYPVHLPGWQAALAPLERWANGLDGVLVLGRQGLFVPDNTHHVLAMGEAAAAAVRADGSIDAVAWSASRAGFDEHVVED